MTHLVRLNWKPSFHPSITQRVVAKVTENGGQVRHVDHTPTVEHATSYSLIVTDKSTIRWWVESVDREGRTTKSVEHEFQVTDKLGPPAATDLSACLTQSNYDGQPAGDVAVPGDSADGLPPVTVTAAGVTVPQKPIDQAFAGSLSPTRVNDLPIAAPGHRDGESVPNPAAENEVVADGSSSSSGSDWTDPAEGDSSSSSSSSDDWVDPAETSSSSSSAANVGDPDADVLVEPPPTGSDETANAAGPHRDGESVPTPGDEKP